jgi:prepilin-type N-terminal cleavage/methylation domain-containing protein
MNRKLLLNNMRGFTLIELLIVMALLGLLMTAVYSLYSTHQKAAYTEDEVVEVQQNLRIAMDSITRDIRLAGFLIPRTGVYTPINAGLTSNATGTLQPLPAPNNVNSDSITVNTISTFGTYARIDPPPGTSFTYNALTADFPVDSPDSADMFNKNDTVRIVRTADRGEPLSTTFTVKVTDRNAVPPTITLTGPGTPTVYQRGDIITKVSATVNTINPPGTVTFCLGSQAGVASCGGAQATCPAGQLCLIRIENIGSGNNAVSSVVAANMAGLKFRYLMDDGSESALPTPANFANFNQIRAVRVLLIGQTSTTVKLSGGKSKVRQVESVIELRNR